MKKQHTFFLLFLLFCFPISIFSQTYYKKDLLIADLDTLYSTIYHSHPNMFTVVPQKVFEENIEKIKVSLKDSTNIFSMP